MSVRRHLTKSQLSAIAARMLPHLHEEAAKRQREHGGTAPGRSSETLMQQVAEVFGTARDQAGALVGVSGETVRRAAVVQREDPAMFQQVEKGIARALNGQ